MTRLGNVGGGLPVLDWTFVASICSMRQVLQDCHRLRKILFFVLYALMGTLVVLMLAFQGDNVRDVLYSKRVAEDGFLIVVAYSFLAAPVAVLVMQGVTAGMDAKYGSNNDGSNSMMMPSHHPNTSNVVVVIQDNEQDNPDIGVVIVMSHREMAAMETIRSCLVHFMPHQVFVVEAQPLIENNERQESPDESALQHLTDDERRLFAETLARVQHVTVPLAANNNATTTTKMLALYTALKATRRYPRVLVLDGGVVLPTRLKFDRRMFRNRVKVVCYPVLLVADTSSSTSTTTSTGQEEQEQHAQQLQQNQEGQPQVQHRSSSPANLLMHWQGLERQMQDYGRAFQSRFATTVYNPQHGGGGGMCLWERTALLKCLEEQSTLVAGEYTGVSANTGKLDVGTEFVSRHG